LSSRVLPSSGETGQVPDISKWLRYNGRWEDVFTNRDACYVAISEDDGQTRIGFREMRLNPFRNTGDLDKRANRDYSVHQPQTMELPGGKVLVAHGQDAEVRALVIFDLEWLYEPSRRSTFENGLSDWSAQKKVRLLFECTLSTLPAPEGRRIAAVGRL
jgi:hypothetical protein